MSIELARFLTTAGLVTKDEVESALFESVASGVPFVRVLLDRGNLDEDAFEDELGRTYGPALRHVAAETHLFAKLPAGMCRRLYAVPIRFDAHEGIVEVACLDPLDTHTAREFAFHLAAPIRIVWGGFDAIEDALRRVDSGDSAAAHQSRRVTPPFLHGAPTSTVPPPPPPEDVPIPLTRLAHHTAATDAAVVMPPATKRGLASKRPSEPTTSGESPHGAANERSRGETSQQRGLAEDAPPNPQRGGAAAEPRRPAGRRPALKADLSPFKESSSPSIVSYGWAESVPEGPGRHPAAGSIPPEPHEERSAARPDSSLARGDEAEAAQGPPPLPEDDLGVVFASLRKATKRDAVIALVLRGLERLARRVAVFVVKRDGFHGWACNPAFGDQGRLRTVAIASELPSILATTTVTPLYVGPIPATTSHKELLDVMGWATADVVAVAVKAGGRVAMVLVCDELEEVPAGVKRVQELARVAGETLSRLLAARP